MASGRIKGITIEIDGDTTKLTTALKQVDKQIRDTQSSLLDVNKLLKMDPGNADLLAQKQKYLTDAIDATKKKLEEEKTALEQLKNGPQTDDTVRQQEALTREIADTEQQLKSLTEEYKNFGSVAGQQLQTAGQKMQDVGDKISGAGTKMLPLTGVVAAAGVAAVKTAADFDSGMSQVSAVSGATGSDLEKLRDKAREMGEKTKFSASEAAEAMNYMAMAGWKTEDMLGGIEGVMNLAAASGEDLATTSDIVTDALTAFGLSANDSGHFADILAAASSNANTNVSMMGETFKYAAPVAGALGFSAEDTAEAIGLMANAGIKSSQAGTSLRTIMTNLTGPITLVGEKLGEVTVETTNSDGSMRSLREILSDLRGHWGQLSESEQAATAESIAGKNAMSGFLALMNAGESDISKLEGAIDTCSDSMDGYNGTAEKMAAVMQDNLEGQLTILKSQLEELAISVGEILMPVVRDIVTHIQSFVDKLNSLPEPVKQTIVTIALVAAAVGPVLIVIGKVISSVGGIITVVGKFVGFMSATAIPAIASVAPVILPILPIIAAVVAAIIAVIAIVKNWGAISEWFKGVWETVCKGVETIGQGLGDFFSGLWDGIKSVTETVWNGIKGFFEGLWNGIKSTAETVFGGIKSFLGDTWDGIKSAAGTAWEGIKGGLSTAWEGIKTTAGTTFETIKTNIGTAWENVKSNTSTAWENIKGTINEKGGGIKGVIGTALEGYKSLWSAGFSAINQLTGGKLGDALSTAKTKMEGIRSAISGAMENAKSAVSGALEKIKGFFSGCKLEFPKIKLPHFSLEGKFSLDPPSVPKISVSWYRKAMDDAYILNSPTIFGMAGGRYLGGGEAGSEAVIGTDKLAEIVRTAVASVSGGTTVIPVYIGQERIDEIVVRAARSQNFRSGGR
ncbi:MAG: phage tail tape measure protein [Eubacterium sp.]